MMKKLVCGCFGNIYYTTILKNGIMSDKDRVEVTDDALTSVLYHRKGENKMGLKELCKEADYVDRGGVY